MHNGKSFFETSFNRVNFVSNWQKKVLIRLYIICSLCFGLDLVLAVKKCPPSVFTCPLEGNYLWPFTKRFKVLSFVFNFLQLSEDFGGKYHLLSKIVQLNVRAWGSKIWMATKSTFFEARVLSIYMNLHCLHITWVV